MNMLIRLFEFACGHDVELPERGSALRLRLLIAAGLAATALAALWGLAAGSTSFLQALQNLYKVPAVVLLSTLAALPIGHLVARLIAPRGVDLNLGFVTGVFIATLILAALAPFVALYYHSSAVIGPWLALGSVALALLGGSITFLRALLSRRDPAVPRRRILAPAFVFLLAQSAALVQFVALASPILPEVTVFDGGVDSMLHR